MKYILIIIAALALCGCQSNNTLIPNSDQDSLRKVDDFINGRSIGEKEENATIVIFEATDPSYQPNIMSPVTSILFNYREDPILGLKKMDELIENEIVDGANILSNQQKADLLFSSYGTLRSFILPPENEIESKHALKYLARLLKYTEPAEIKLLTDALLLAKDSMSIEAYYSARQYILQESLPKEQNDLLDQVQKDRFIKERKYANKVLLSSN